MKKLAALFLLITVTIVTFSQQTSPVPLRQQDYLQKSKNQKTWAWIVTGIGAGIVTVGLLTQDYIDAFSGIAEEKNSASPVVYVAGGTFIASGIVLFVASSRNRKKAISSSGILKMEKTTLFEKHTAVINIYPAAGIRINLK